MEKNMNLKKLCELLSISEATGRNWLRLHKITPDATQDGKPCFSSDYIKKLQAHLAAPENTLLKRRRNKTACSGHLSYRDYISRNSPNQAAIKQVAKYWSAMSGMSDMSSPLLLHALLASCSMGFAAQILPSQINLQSSSQINSQNDLQNSSQINLQSSPQINLQSSPQINSQNNIQETPVTKKSLHFLHQFILQELSVSETQLADLRTHYPELFSLPFTYIDGEDTLGALYLSLRDLTVRKKTGAYYTPQYLVKQCIEEVFGDIMSGEMPENKIHGNTSSNEFEETPGCSSSFRILDPACGTGNFLLQLPEELPLSAIYGIDIDATGVALSRINLLLRQTTQAVQKTARFSGLSGSSAPSDSSSFPGAFGFSSATASSGASVLPSDTTLPSVLMLSEWASTVRANIITKDFLSCRIKNTADGNLRPQSTYTRPETLSGCLCLPAKSSSALSCGFFTHIIGNPPWGSVFSPAQAKKLARRFSCSRQNHLESFVLFSEQALRFLAPDGILSFVLPEAVLSVHAHLPLRSLLCQSCRILTVSYLGSLFPGVQCPCILFTIQKTGRPLSCQGCRVHSADRTFTIHTERPLSPDSFHLLLNDQEYALFQKLQNTPNCTTLASHADFALGIVTGDNARTLKKISSASESSHPVLRGKNIAPYRITPADMVLAVPLSECQQAASDKFYLAPEKLIYRFICDRPVVACDNQQHFLLNSCNLLIPHIDGMHIKYIAAVLNSRVTAFLYRAQFTSLKVLRSHLECLPIPLAGAEEQEKIVQLVEILECTDTKCSDTSGLDSPDISAVQKELDQRIEALFGLTQDDSMLLKLSP